MYSHIISYMQLDPIGLYPLSSTADAKDYAFIYRWEEQRLSESGAECWLLATCATRR